jgi:hypothetical protein
MRRVVIGEVKDGMVRMCFIGILLRYYDRRGRMDGQRAFRSPSSPGEGASARLCHASSWTYMGGLSARKIGGCELPRGPCYRSPDITYLPPPPLRQAAAQARPVGRQTAAHRLGVGGESE